MFTGLIKDIGKILAIRPNPEGKEFTILAPKIFQDIQVDDSVATNGVCLTATQIQDKSFKAQAIHVTLEKTNLGELNVGDLVNLELALRPMDRLGGHLVQGHVSGTGVLKSLLKRGKNWELTFTANDKNLFKYMILEGSIAIDGISLTIARLTNNEFTVAIIPHTYENTILHEKKIGDSINIEVDMMAKYLENFMRFNKPDAKFDLESWYKEQTP
jgi:riboflavin synthase